MNFVNLVDGDLFVETLGMPRMPKLCADNWAMIQQVSLSRDNELCQLCCKFKGSINNADGAAQPTAERIPRNFLINLNQVNCNGTETTLTQCPHVDTVCLQPGAGVICPNVTMETTSHVPETSSPTEAPQTTTTTNEGRER